MNKSLYTATEITKERNRLLVQQDFTDPVLDEKIGNSTAVCDHDHTTQHCRAVLHRQTNAFEGLVFNAYKRCLSWVTAKELPVILRNLADYLEVDYSGNPYHPGWIKRVKVLFNKLNAEQQNKCLVELGYNRGSNPKQRKEYFAKATMDRSLGFERIVSTITETKGS